MARDVFGTEMRPGDLFVYSSAGNGYFTLECVPRVMPKSVEHGDWGLNKVHSEKCIVVSEEKARTFIYEDAEDKIEKSRAIKEEYGIED